MDGDNVAAGDQWRRSGGCEGRVERGAQQAGGRPDMTEFDVKAIGRVESSLIDMESAPRQADEGAPEAWLVFESEVLDGLQNIRAGDDVLVLTWLDRARRADLARLGLRA
jgi:hypothetical protein